MQGTQATRQDAPALRFEAEELHYALSYAGRTAGTLRWMAQPEKGLIVVRLEANFTGVIGQGIRRVQTSKIDPVTRLPIQFTENNGQGGHHFEANFDRRSGLVTIKQNRDEASQALTRDYHDPLSIIQFLRDLPDEASGIRVPMIGGSVVVARLPDAMVETPSGPRLARVFYLRPGLGLVFIDAEAPHRPLRFTQAVGKYMLEAMFSRAGVVPQGTRIGAPQTARIVVVQAQAARQERGRGQQNQPRSRNPQPQAKAVPAKSSASGSRPDQAPRVKANLSAPPSSTSPEQTAEAQPEGGNRRRRRRFRRRGKGGGGEGSGS